VSAARRWLVVALAAVAVLWPLLLAAGRWPRWWEWIASEQTPMTWLQSVVLVVSGCLCVLVALVLRRAGATGRDRWNWWLFGAGFGVLALDERFAVHERVRDGVLAPRGVSVPFLPWVAPGDFLVLTIGLVGLAALPLVWSAVRPDRAARTALLVAVALGVLAVGVDSIDPATWTVQGERLQQTLEEVVEQWCGTALLACVAQRLLGLLDALLPAAAPPPAPTAPAASGESGESGRDHRLSDSRPG
jgi:hypothetical protein